MPQTENPKALCIFCGSFHSSFKYTTSDTSNNTYELRQCNDCFCYFLFPLPSAEILKNAYDTSYYGASSHKFGVKLVAMTVDYFRKKRASKIARIMKENQRVLDIGCGRGDFLLHLSEHGKYELHGIELNESALIQKVENSNIHIKSSPLQKEDFSENFFDVITMFHVFEHLSEPKKNLEIISKILKPGGVLVISFPNIASWQAKLFKGKWLHLDPPRHLLFFEPYKFIEIMKSFNFIMNEDANHFSLEQNPYGFFQSVLNVFCKKREVFFERLKGNKLYAPEYGIFKMFFQKCFFVFSFPLFVIVSFFESVFRKGASVQFVFKNNKL